MPSAIYRIMRNAFDGQLNLLVTCASGIEKATKKELERLGFNETQAINGEIALSGDAFSVARLNLNLRTADRVYVKVGEFIADTFDALFDGVKSLAWESFLPKNASVIVNGKCVRSKLFAVSACQGMVKKAIADRISNAYGMRRMSEDGATYAVEFRLFKDRCELLIDTTGVGLHKRGYRDMVGIAPIRETLASALVLMSDYYYKRPFADPFCGSGTIAIETARIALNIASGKDRKFAFNDWQNFDKHTFNLAREQALDNEIKDREIEIFASDIDSKAITLARHHAQRAGVGDKIHFAVKDVKNFTCDIPCGTIVTNPPYGERVYDIKDAERCYKGFGEAFKKLDDWSAFVITSAKCFQSAFGKRADRERKIFNSNRECRFFYYYADKKNEKQ